jgi:hypothetical protein
MNKNFEVTVKHSKVKEISNDVTRVYYVYKHTCNGEVFYIGAGKGYRYRKTTSRSKKWYEVTKDCKFKAEIVKNNLTLDEAVTLEKELIAKYGRKHLGTGNLINFTEGGETIDTNNNLFGKKLIGIDNPNYNNRGGNNPLSKKIYRLDFDGNIVAEYDAIIDVKNDGFNEANVSNCLAKRRKQHKGYQFIYQNEYDPNKSYTYNRGKTSVRPVVQLDKDGNFIKYYPSSSNTKEYGFNSSVVNQVCNGSKKSHKGYLWVFFDTLDTVIQSKIMTIVNKDIV